MKLAMEGILNYAGYHRRPSRCDIRVYNAVTAAERAVRVPPVVILTERADNPGTSITDRIKVIATVMYHILGQPAEGITVIEHDEDRAFIGGRATSKETFDLVAFTWTGCQEAIGPLCTPMTKAQVEELIAIRQP